MRERGERERERGRPFQFDSGRAHSETVNVDSPIFNILTVVGHSDQ